MGPYTELSLFTGYGGFSLGLRLAGVDVQTVCYVELDAYCQQVIQARIQDGYMDDAPIWDDIRTFDGRPWRESVDLLTAGFPCQPHSVAGQRRGVDDERNLWPDTLRVIRDVGPCYVLLENVPGILANGYGGTVVGELSEAGYDCVWDCVSAQEVGAPHRRLRWWCLAYSQEFIRRRESQLWPEGSLSPGISSGCEAVADHDCERCRASGQNNGFRETNPSIGSSSYVANPKAGGKQGIESCGSGPFGFGSGRWWAVEPDVGRVANGVASRVDRLRALGNGIVPAVVQQWLTPRVPAVRSHGQDDLPNQISQSDEGLR